MADALVYYLRPGETTITTPDDASQDGGGGGEQVIVLSGGGMVPRHSTIAVSKGGGPGGASIIVLRKGVHFLNETLALDARDSGLTIQNHEGPPDPEASFYCLTN